MKIKFWEDEKGDQSSSRLIFILGSLWNMAQCSVVVWVLLHTVVGIAIYAAAAGAWASIQAVLSAYILINKNEEMKRETINEVK